jgi:hypothetical protein
MNLRHYITQAIFDSQQDGNLRIIAGSADDIRKYCDLQVRHHEESPLSARFYHVARSYTPGLSHCTDRVSSKCCPTDHGHPQTDGPAGWKRVDY